MKTITFTSHYNKVQLNMHISDENAAALFSHEFPMEAILDENERIANDYEPKYLSMGQVKKLNSYLSGIDCWATVELA